MPDNLVAKFGQYRRNVLTDNDRVFRSFANHSSKPNCVPKVKLVNGKTTSSARTYETVSSGDYRIGIYAKQVIFEGEELFFEYMYDAHQRQQFVNNERVDQVEQDGLTVLKRYGDNLLLVRSSYD